MIYIIALLNTDKKRDKLGFLFSEKKKLSAKINQSIINMNKLPKIKYSVICKPAKVAVVKYEPKVIYGNNKYKVLNFERGYLQFTIFS